MDEMSEMKKHAEETQDISHDANSEKGKYMTFKSGNEYFGLGIQYVNEIIQIQEITAIPETENYIKGLINLRGKIVPVIDVADRFGKESFEYNDRTCIIVIDVQNVVVGLIVEKILEVVSIEEEDILPPPNSSKGSMQGKFISGIGSVGESIKLLLDPVKLLSDNSLDFADNQEDEEDE